jgi:hypothetical protein
VTTAGVGLQTQSALITGNKTVFQICASLSNFIEMMESMNDDRTTKVNYFLILVDYM